LRQLVHRQHAVDQQNLVVVGGKRALYEGAQFFRHLGFDFEPDHRSPPPPLQRGFKQPHQIFRLFLDFELGIPDDAEGALAFDGIAGEQPPDEQPVACSRVISRTVASLPAGRRMKRSILPGMRMSAFIGLPSETRARCSATVNPRLGINGKGCAGSIASGVSNGKILWRK